MSLPTYSITCSKCNFDESYGFYTCYEYQGKPEQSPILIPAWCADCDKILNVCTPFTPEEVEAEISERDLWIKKNSGLLALFSKKRKNEFKEAREEIRELQARLQYFETTS